MTTHPTPSSERDVIALPRDTVRFLQSVLEQHWPTARDDAEWFEMQHRVLLEALAALRAEVGK